LKIAFRRQRRRQFCKDLFTADRRALVLRNVWWHPGKGREAQALASAQRQEKAGGKLPALQEYYLQSAMDSLGAVIFMFLGQGLEQYLAPAAAVPPGVLFRVAALALPLIPMIRLILRPMPDPKSPFEGKGMSAIEVFRATCRLNILWAVMYCGTVMRGTSDIPEYVPDKLRGFLPLFVLMLFVVVQRDGLERFSWLQKVLVSWEQRALARYERFLWKKLKPGDPFYWAYKVLRVLIFACFGLFIEATVRPWNQRRSIFQIQSIGIISRRL